jgi:hypothetical protein
VPECRLRQIESQWDEMQVRLINAATHEAAGGPAVLKHRNHAVVNPKSLTDVSSKCRKGPSLS